MNRRFTLLIIAIALSLFIFVSYGGVINNELLTYDDLLYLDRSEVKAGLTPEGIRWALTNIADGNYLPMPWLSFMLDVTTLGIDARAHHAVNLALHITNAVLLMLALARMTGQVWRSAAVAALFALHPLHVESVAWLAQREDLLGGLFFALTLLAYQAYVRQPTAGRYAAVTVLFILGLCSRQMLLTLPFLLLLLDFWPFKRTGLLRHASDSSARRPLRSLVIEKIPLFMIMAAFAVAGLIIQRKTGTVITYAESSLPHNIANALVSYSVYVYKTVLPLKLSVYYPFSTDIPLWQVAGSAVLLMSLSFIILRARRTFPYLMVGWFWFIGTLIPAIGIIRFGDQAMADRYTYLPLTGLFIAAVWGMADMAEKRKAQPFLLGATVIVLGIYGVLSFVQTGHWRNTFTLFSHAAEVTEDNWVAMENLGTHYARQGDLEKGRYYLQEAVHINPRYAIAHANLGILYGNLGDHDSAISHYMTALELKPNDDMTRFNLGLTLVTAKGDIAGAMNEYGLLLTLNPEKADFLLKVISQYGQMQRGSIAQ